MLYPIFSYNDGTEVTASKIETDGTVKVHTEKFDEISDRFIYATIAIPNARVLSSEGYSDEELNALLERYSKIQEDIIDYVAEKEVKSA